MADPQEYGAAAAGAFETNWAGDYLKSLKNFLMTRFVWGDAITPLRTKSITPWEQDSLFAIAPLFSASSNFELSTISASR
jgi:hypothetical protein